MSGQPVGSAGGIAEFDAQRRRERLAYGEGAAGSHGRNERLTLG